MLCGKRVRDFEKYRADKKGEVAYHLTLRDWLADLDNQIHDNGNIVRKTIRNMIETEASKRPSAVEVARIMRECKTSGGLVFSGDCSDHF